MMLMLLLAQEQRVCSVSPLIESEGSQFSKPYLNVIVVLRMNIKQARVSVFCCVWESIINTDQITLLQTYRWKD